MAEPTKDTIYIDIDDEITAIIDKVRASNAKVIALVLPKRASVLQSIVNMKLLKRSADSSKKNLVLITSEAGLLPLAGAVGLYVAKTPQSKPEIPAANEADDDAISDGSVDDDEEITAKNAGAVPVGELAAGAAAGSAPVRPVFKVNQPEPDPIETLQMEDDLTGDEEAATTDVPETTKAVADRPVKVKKDHKLAVPNFDRFRLRLVLGVLLLIILGAGYYVAANVLPKGTVTIVTDTSNVNSSLALNLDSTVKTLDATKLVVPAQVQQLQKTGTQQAAASGKKNEGVQATGKVTLSLPDCSVTSVTVPAGTGVKSNGLIFITQADATMSSVKIGSSCKNSAFPDFSTATVNVTAQVGGSQYNIAAATFTVSGYPGVAASSSAAMGGGTDNNVQVVAQSDIDSATQKIVAQNADAIKQQLTQQLTQAGMFALPSTFTTGTPQTTTSAKAGDQVATVTVTQTTSYTMFGVKKADLKTLVDNDVKKHIDPSKQSILDEGLTKATFKQNDANDKTAQLTMNTTAVAGPDLQTNTVKAEIAGKKAGDIKTMLKANPGVSDVKVQLSPFWVTSAPSKPAKLTVVFQKSNGSGQ